MLAASTRGLAEGAGRAVLPAVAAWSGRLVQTAAASPSEVQQQQKQQKRQERPAAPGVPATLPEVLPAPERGLRNLSLNSINDPQNWGLAMSPQGSADEFFWLSTASSLSNPKESATPPRSGAPSPRPPQGFRTATSGPSVQRKILNFRSSMVDPRYHSLTEPELPLASVAGAQLPPASPMEPELPFAFQTSMADPPLLHRPSPPAPARIKKKN